MNYHKISFCTVCMNRLHHIEKTLIQNIENNTSYPHFEYVLLDYGSTDGLEEWVNQSMQKYLQQGTLKFYRTSQPAYFDRSHSRNLMFKLSSGDIICNIDADNYAGEGFANYVNTSFNENNNIYLVADTKKRFYFLRNAFGRFCVKKSDFEVVGGLDEKMKSYGSETLDFYERLNMAGKKESVIENTRYLKAISHGDEERISNEYFIKSLEKFYIRYLHPEESELIMLFKDGKFENCKIIPEKTATHLPAALKEGSLQKGSWIIEADFLTLKPDHKPSLKLKIEDKTIHTDNSSINFFLIDDKNFLLQIAKNYSFITNTETLNENKTNKQFYANDGVYGQSAVTKNFLEELVIL